MFRADLRAEFGYVAIADPERIFQFTDAIFGVERVHLERGDVNKKPSSDKFGVLFVISQHVADILAEQAFDAFSEFLDAVDVRLLHSPGTILRIRRTRL